MRSNGSRPLRTTIHDVARLAEVSVSTVSRYLNGSPHVSEEARRRIELAVRKLMYRPSQTARTMRTRHSRTLGLVIPDIAHPFFAEVIRGAEEAAATRGYTVFLVNTAENPEKERQLLEALVDKDVDGILYGGGFQLDGLGRNMYEMPVVVIDREINLPQAHAILVDNLAGACEATAHLLAEGRRRIAVLTGPRRHRTNFDRYEGFVKASQEAGRDLTAAPNAETVVSIDAGREAVLAWLDSGMRFDAIFAANDLLAVGALQALSERQIGVPADCAVVGFDNITLSALVRPALTTVDQPKYEMGRLGAEYLIREIEGEPALERRTVLRPRLVVRQSCGPH
ncbi:MAG: LacI family DNA-binding transcriptional regulator [Bacillota bacterium]